MREIWWNGKFIPSPTSPPFLEDSGLLFGEGLFETVKVREGRACFLQSHINRLLTSSEELSLSLPLSREELLAGIQGILERGKVKEGVMRIFLTPGNLYLTLHKGLPYTGKKSFRVTFSDFPRNEESPLVRHKVMSFFENRLARQEAQKKGFEEAIFLNRKGELTEGAFSNLFLVKEDLVLTPPLGSGILPGIIRGEIIRLGEEMGIPVREKILRPEDLKESREIFLTSSLMGVMPVREVEGWFQGEQFPLTLRLREALLKKEESTLFP